MKFLALGDGVRPCRRWRREAAKRLAVPGGVLGENALTTRVAYSLPTSIMRTSLRVVFYRRWDVGIDLVSILDVT